MKVLEINRKALTATIELDRETKEVTLSRYEYPYFVEYTINHKVAVKTSHGAKLHCANFAVNFGKNTHWENDELINDGETDEQGIDISWSGARGNGVGFSSNLAYVGFADNFKKEDFSKATQYLYSKGGE